MERIGFTRAEIGVVLKELRVASGMTQREVAEQLGRRQQIVGHWETGYAQPDLNTFFQLCLLYKADVAVSFGCSVDAPLALTSSEIDLVSSFRMASSDEKELIKVILKKYREGTALSILNSLYSASVERWPPANKDFKE